MAVPSWLAEYVQTNLFNYERPLNQSVARVVIGQYFEQLAAHMFNGKQCAITEDDKVYPDVLIKEGILEVKASSNGEFLIDMKQLRFYRLIRSTVRYALFIYDLHDICREYKSVPALLKGLSLTESVCILMSFRQLLQLLEGLPLKHYGAWATNGRLHYVRTKKEQFKQILKKEGTLVNDISVGGNPVQPVRLIQLCGGAYGS